MPLDEKELKELLDACLNGEPIKQRDFYYHYYSTVMRICIRYAKNMEDAEQWCNDSFVKIFSSLHTYKNAGSFEGWLKRIVVNICIDQIRKSNRIKYTAPKGLVHLSEEMANMIDYVPNDVHKRLSAQEVLTHLKILPEKEKLVFNLYVFEEYSHKEVAALLNITESYSNWLFFQARKKMKTIIHSIIDK